jgi:hypothetical protein
MPKDSAAVIAIAVAIAIGLAVLLLFALAACVSLSGPCRLETTSHDIELTRTLECQQGGRLTILAPAHANEAMGEVETIVNRIRAAVQAGAPTNRLAEGPSAPLGRPNGAGDAEGLPGLP